MKRFFSFFLFLALLGGGWYCYHAYTQKLGKEVECLISKISREFEVKRDAQEKRIEEIKRRMSESSAQLVSARKQVTLRERELEQADRLLAQAEESNRAAIERDLNEKRESIQVFLDKLDVALCRVEGKREQTPQAQSRAQSQEDAIKKLEQEKAALLSKLEEAEQKFEKDKFNGEFKVAYHKQRKAEDGLKKMRVYVSSQAGMIDSKIRSLQTGESPSPALDSALAEKIQRKIEEQQGKLEELTLEKAMEGRPASTVEVGKRKEAKALLNVSMSKLAEAEKFNADQYEEFQKESQELRKLESLKSASLSSQVAPVEVRMESAKTIFSWSAGGILLFLFLTDRILKRREDEE